MKKIKLLLEYDGSRYNGWQSQPECKGVLTVQDEIEKCVKKVLKSEKVSVISAGRTDSGVHALGQVAVFSADAGFTLAPETVKKALNAMLPPDISVIEASECPAGFHPRRDAKKKTYFYLIAAMHRPPVFVRPYSWRIPYELNMDAMRKAAVFFAGRKDFSSFRAAGCGANTPVKELSGIEITRLRQIEFMAVRFSGEYLKISLTADGFLRHMARNIVGTLVETGRGRIKPEQIVEILEARDRKLAGPSAPAHGLFLERVYY